MDSDRRLGEMLCGLGTADGNAKVVELRLGEPDDIGFGSAGIVALDVGEEQQPPVGERGVG